MSETASGWIEPENRDKVAEYWLTRRDADAKEGFAGFGADLRVKYKWGGINAWITGTRIDRQGRPVAVLSCLHANNGWRIEGPACPRCSEVCIDDGGCRDPACPAVEINTN